MDHDSDSDEAEQELAVVQSIYGDANCVDLRQQDVWKVSRKPELTLRLFPNHDSLGGCDDRLSVQLHLKLDADYPRQPPCGLSVQQAHGLSDELARQLEAELRAHAQTLKGSVMITELAQFTSEWLYEHGRRQRPSYGSFYEEMEALQREQVRLRERAEREAAEQHARRESIELQTIREEVDKKREALYEERQKRRSAPLPLPQSRSGDDPSGEAASSLSPSPMEAPGSGRARSGSFYRRSHFTSQSVSESGDAGANGGLDRSHGPEEIRFTLKGEKVKVDKLSRLLSDDEQSGAGGGGADVFLGNMHGRTLAVYEWNFPVLGASGKSKSKNKDSDVLYDAPTLLKQLATIEQEMSSVQKLAHPHVLSYHGLTYERLAHSVRLHVFEEFAFGSNLSYHLTRRLPVDLALLRHYARGVLGSLEYMHANNIVHRHLRATSVFVENNGVVRVGDFSIDKRVRDLWAEHLARQHAQQDVAVDDAPVGVGRGGKKIDVYCLGVLVLSLALGDAVRGEPDVPKRVFPSELTDFLRKCLNRDERERWTSSQLLDHSWMRADVGGREPALLALQRKKDVQNADDDDDRASPMEPEEEEEEEVAVPFQTVGRGQSRLQSEFSFISKIGQGAFGEVMKVKNTLDGQVYAIKKIKLNQKNKQARRKLMREVKLLSRLNHENVVRYYTSWIEMTTVTEDNRKETETSFDEESLSAMPGGTSTRSNTPMKTGGGSVGTGKKKRSLLESLKLHAPILNSPIRPIAEERPGMTEEDEDDYSFSFDSRILQDDEDSDSDDSSSSSGDEDGEEGDDGDGDDDAFGASFLPKSSSLDDDYDNGSDSEIVFEYSNGERRDEDEEESEESDTEESRDEDSSCPDKNGRDSSVTVTKGSEVKDGHVGVNKLEIRLMYIQMEYCDNKTLRNAIDEGMYRNGQRVWRMFREILVGLVHIHTQGMIHRDLKPVNIFIDSHDHVKIGDFGLATTNMHQSNATSSNSKSFVAPMSQAVLNNDSLGGASGGLDMTGQIGTALYVAPEINAGRVTQYTQKVDIYSLGVIFFEMCYPPLSTGMERIKVLNDLRSQDIALPDDFDQSLHMQQTSILKWLLNHDPTKRPNSQELVQSDFLPPPQIEEVELQDMVRRTLANSKSKMYRHLIDSCLAQHMTRAQDISYDMELAFGLGSGGGSAGGSLSLGNAAKRERVLKKTLVGQEYVRQVMQRVFHRHGAVHVQLSHLLPKGERSVYDNTAAADNLVQVMQRGGGVVSLPYDLRVPFARLLARTQLNNIKRYSIAPVFREVNLYGFHPREQIECAFDIVTPTHGGGGTGDTRQHNLWADAEVLSVTDELLREFPTFASAPSSYFFRLNHGDLLEGILLNYNIDEQLHDSIYRVIREADRWSKHQRTSSFTNLGLSEQVAGNLLRVLEHEGAPSKIASLLRHILRRRNNPASSRMKQALADLEKIMEIARSMGVASEMVIAPSLVYNPGHFAGGMVCQLVRRKKKRGHHEVMAAGGRYDRLVASFAEKFNLGGGAAMASNRRTGESSSSQCGQSAVGISISMDRLLAAAADDVGAGFSAIEVLIYSEPRQSSSLVKDKAELASRLWGLGVRTGVCGDQANTASADEVLEQARDFRASFVVLLRESEPGAARVRCVDKDHVHERRVPFVDVAEFVQKQLRQAAASGSGFGCGLYSADLGPTSGQSSSALASASDVGHGASQSSASSASSSASSAQVFLHNSHVNYNFRYLDKARHKDKKRLEVSMSARITGLLQLLSPHTTVDVLALPVPRAVTKSMAAVLDFDDEAKFAKSVKELVERHPRHRKDLSGVCEDVRRSKFEKNCSVFVFYSTEDQDFASVLAN